MADPARRRRRGSCAGSLQLRQGDAKSLQETLEKLPADFREALVLREMEEMSYKEIAEITGVALGTVIRWAARKHAL